MKHPSPSKDTPTYEAIRRSFKPDNVRMLFVGESRPASGKFFYVPPTPMLRYTQQAFVRALAWPEEPPVLFLKRFKDAGCYLVDLCEEPVNHLQQTERRKVLLGAVPQLSRQLKHLGPDVVVAIMKSIGPLVLKAIEGAEFNCKHHRLPFPGNGWQKVFVDDLAALISEYGRL